MLIVQMIIYVALSVSGMTMVKLGSTVPAALSFENKIISFHIGAMTLAGLVCYVCSFLMYMILISKHTLSYLIPISTGLTYVATMLVSYWLFKERMTGIHIFASLLILAGVLLINIKKA